MKARVKAKFRVRARARVRMKAKVMASVTWIGSTIRLWLIL